jgi:hypothetical protein
VKKQNNLGGERGILKDTQDLRCREDLWGGATIEAKGYIHLALPKQAEFRSKE